MRRIGTQDSLRPALHLAGIAVFVRNPLALAAMTAGQFEPIRFMGWARGLGSWAGLVARPHGRGSRDGLCNGAVALGGLRPTSPAAGTVGRQFPTDTAAGVRWFAGKRPMERCCDALAIGLFSAHVRASIITM